MKFVPTRNTFLSVDGKQVYHLGIIDYLQDFNLEKTAECYAKKSINAKGAEISAVPPRDYAPRFLNFMREKVLIDQKENIDKSHAKIRNESIQMALEEKEEELKRES
mmetsp:Transcript_27991/g.37915  ORF Transcript_27991/g.37915 Transcript_27991/m.37915 type:complete len:107 (+) Transcript_27991:2165-2485(+)